MLVKELIKELKKKNQMSKVFVIVHKTIKKWLYELEDEIPIFEDEETGKEDTDFTMLSVDHNKK